MGQGRENKVKRILRDGGVPIGTMVFEFSTAGIGRIAAAAGADFAMFDMEHTGWSVETIRGLIAASRAADLEPMVRVPAAQYTFIARALDVGARGIMVPMVETEDQARTIVESAKYPPQGRRGTCFAVAHDDYLDGDIAEKMRSANAEGVVIAQIESARGLENLERIAAVGGIDVLWIGHFDLTTSMGIPGQFDDPRYVDAVERVIDACRRHGLHAGFMAKSPEEGEALVRKGFRILAYWGDLWIYRQALSQGVSALRERIGPLLRHRP
ncbi:MAG: aldolase [Planctomycetes bacterium]|nr:aldolase [Planctomycetota bacterium]